MASPTPALAHEILAAGRFIALSKAPYFRAKIYNFVPRETPGLGTISTTINGILRYDPLTIATWTADEMAGGWLHEALHSVLQFWKRCGSRDPKLWNMAQDLAINPMVLEQGAQLPKGALFPEQFEFPRGLTSDEYYDLLDQKGIGPKEDAGCGSGHCGGVAGHGHPGEPDASDEDGRSEAEQERSNRAVAEAIREAQEKGGRSAGTIPSELLRWTDAVLAPAKVPWREKLARIARQAVAYRPGCVEHRYDQPGRRQAGIGFGPGKPIMPRFRQPVPRVMVVVDTSGSMGDAEGLAALAEVDGIMKGAGADVTFSACDAQATPPRVVRSMADVAQLLVGGGGTLFQPAFDAAALAFPRPEVAVLVTDGGWFDQPVIPPWLSTIIVLVGKNRMTPTFSGLAEIIEVDDDDGPEKPEESGEETE